MAAIGTFTPEQARELWQWYQTAKQLRPDLTRNYPQRRPIDEPSPHRVFVKNASGEEIPAYACMRVTGTETVAGKKVLTVEKPSSTDGAFLFNSQFAIPVPSATKSGVGWAYKFGVVIMLGDEPTEPGDLYKPIVGSWEIESGGNQFSVYGRHEATARALVGRFAAIPHIRHGIITAQLGCGYYTVEKATWSGDPDTAGIGLGSGSGIGDCDPCYDVVGEGTDACGITLTYPPLQVTGIGEYVTAYDEASQLIPLVVGTSCKMVDMGDRINAGSASASGSADGEPCWQILRGVMSHTVQYKITDDDCCDASGQTGTYTVLQKTPIILIGKECSPITCGSCDPGSGS